MCDKPGVTSEHVPPKSFFPDDRRVNLLTVPSCWTHNNGNSKDVEYVRNVITAGWGVNPIGEQVQLKATVAPSTGRERRTTLGTQKLSCLADDIDIGLINRVVIWLIARPGRFEFRRRSAVGRTESV